MSDEIYKKLAKVLDTLPNGYPATESGIEIRLLKKIFTPEEIDLFCDLRLDFETPAQVAERTGRPLEGLGNMLEAMWKRGLVFGADMGSVKLFKMMPWIIGIYEFQLDRMDREFAEMCEEYNSIYLPTVFSEKPQPMQVIPIEKEISNPQEALPYERVSALIEESRSFGVADCICRKEGHLLDKGCDKPLEVCLGLAPIPGIFEKNHWGRPISREDAYQVLESAEKAGLVHMTSNIKDGRYFICNCCGCCCAALRTVNKIGISDGINSHYYAEIDPDTCDSCGICADERCQVNAIKDEDDSYGVIQEKCIGCGLCITTCLSGALRLVHKKHEERITPFKDEMDMFRAKARERGVDFSEFE